MPKNKSLFYLVLLILFCFSIFSLNGQTQDQKTSINPRPADKIYAIPDGVKMNPADLNQILSKRKPNAKLMEIFVDNTNSKKIVFWGKMFEDSPIKKRAGQSSYSIKKEYLFALDAHTEKFLHWKEKSFRFKYKDDDDISEENMINKKTAVQRAQVLFPNSQVVHCEWNIIPDLVYFDVTLSKDEKNIRYIINAYSGKIVKSSEEINSQTLLQANNISQTQLESAVKNVLDKEKSAMMDRVVYSSSDVERFLSSKIPGGIVTNLNLNTEQGFPFYEGSVVHDNKYYRFKLNAENGAIMEWNRQVYHSPVLVLRRGAHTASMPVPPSLPIITSPQTPVPPSAPETISAPTWPQLPLIPNIPYPPALPQRPNIPKVPTPNL